MKRAVISLSEKPLTGLVVCYEMHTFQWANVSKNKHMILFLCPQIPLPSPSAQIMDIFNWPPRPCSYQNSHPQDRPAEPSFKNADCNKSFPCILGHIILWVSLVHSDILLHLWKNGAHLKCTLPGATVILQVWASLLFKNHYEAVLHSGLQTELCKTRKMCKHHL